jgi:aromatic ring-opening dioxygenase catalytic subunit (LigB family)
MAKLVSVAAMAHAPGVTGWLDAAPLSEQHTIEAGYRAVAEAVLRARPDVVIGVANDHMLNLPLKNPPPWCVGTAQAWEGPAEFFKAWLKQPGYKVAGHPEVAEAILSRARREGRALEGRSDLLFDDNWSIPLWFMGYDIPLVPIQMNCINPPVPTPEDSVAFGKLLRKVILDDLPADMRVAFIATGGLSHEPGGPRYFTLDEDFDRWFLQLMEHSDEARVVREATVERMNEAGGGGTTELLAWMVAMAVAGDRARGETVFYVGSREMRCGIGATVWSGVEGSAVSA